MSLVGNAWQSQSLAQHIFNSVDTEKAELNVHEAQKEAKVFANKKVESLLGNILHKPTATRTTDKTQHSKVVSQGVSTLNKTHNAKVAKLEAKTTVKPVVTKNEAAAKMGTWKVEKSTTVLQHAKPRAETPMKAAKATVTPKSKTLAKAEPKPSTKHRTKASPSIPSSSEPTQPVRKMGKIAQEMRNSHAVIGGGKLAGKSKAKGTRQDKKNLGEPKSLAGDTKIQISAEEQARMMEDVKRDLDQSEFLYSSLEESNGNTGRHTAKGIKQASVMPSWDDAKRFLRHFL